MVQFKDEVSCLLELYDLPPESDEFSDLIKKAFTENGRVGATFVEDEALIKLKRYFKNIPVGYKPVAKNLVQEIVSMDFSKQLEEGFEMGKSVFPKVDLIDPVPVLFFDGGYTSACVLGLQDKLFGVNITYLLKEKNSEISDEHSLRLKVKSSSAHESNHIYLEQLIRLFNGGKICSNIPYLVSSLFFEGLATFVEPVHYPQHYEYVKEADFFYELIGMASLAKFQEERQNVLRLAKNSNSINLLKKRVVKEIDVALNSSEVLTKKRYRYFLDEIFYMANGPIYHVGYNMWKTIDENLGREKVIDLTTKHPFHFMKTYEFLKN